MAENIRKGAFLLLRACGALVLGAQFALAETPTRNIPTLCSTYKEHAAYLAREFGEAPVFTGQLSRGLLFRVFANPKTGTWTALMIRTDGRSCVSAAGKNGVRDVGL